MIRLLIIVLASIFAAANPSPGHTASPEQRCSALGVNCLCSEPLEMTAYVKNASGVDAVWNPNDSTTKQCNGENNYDHGSAINRGDSDPPLIGSDPAVLAAFPADASVPRYFRGSEGHTGTYEFGHVLAASDPRTRVAVRWYVYMSPNYVWTTGKTSGVHCLNSAKWFSLRTDADLWLDHERGRLVAAARLLPVRAALDLCRAGAGRGRIAEGQEMVPLRGGPAADDDGQHVRHP